MKNKILIGVIIVTINLLITIVFLSINKSDNFISKKGYIIFGNDKCPRNSFYYTDDEHPDVAATVVTSYKCKLCNKKYDHPDAATPKICSTCATITNRCDYCGKLNTVI